jgi:hypothetical protein
MRGQAGPLNRRRGRPIATADLDRFRVEGTWVRLVALKAWAAWDISA